MNMGMASSSCGHTPRLSPRRHLAAVLPPAPPHRLTCSQVSGLKPPRYLRASPLSSCSAMVLPSPPRSSRPGPSASARPLLHPTPLAAILPARRLRGSWGSRSTRALFLCSAPKSPSRWCRRVSVMPCPAFSSVMIAQGLLWVCPGGGSSSGKPEHHWILGRD